MSDTLEDYRRLKKDIESAKAEHQRAQGALDQLKAQLKREFDCDTIKEAKVKLAELETASEDAKKKFEKAMKDYERKWKE